MYQQTLMSLENVKKNSSGTNLPQGQLRQTFLEMVIESDLVWTKLNCNDHTMSSRIIQKEVIHKGTMTKVER